MSITAMAYQVSGLLEKMQSADKDYRFMATNDLMAELQKDSIKLDDDSERKVVKMLLRLLEDKNGEVQNLAVKCLGPLVNKVKEAQVETIVDTLCSNMTCEKEQLRDVSCIGLKTVIAELPSSGGHTLTANMTRRVAPRLTAVAADSGIADVSVLLEVLDIISDLLLRYGTILSPFHQSIEEVLIGQLWSNRLAVRKRAILALSHLVAVCNDTLFAKVMDILIGQLKNSNSSVSNTRTCVASIAAVARSAGQRFSRYLPQVMPVLIASCKSGTEDDELRESNLQAFESFVYRCPKEISPYMDSIVKLCSEFIQYDPNYHYDDDADMENGVMDTETHVDYDEDEDEEEFSDDDDMSWKVRRAAAKCLDALICARRDQLYEMYRQVGVLLINRFKEREDNVKSDIFHAYMALLRQTKLVVPSQTLRNNQYIMTDEQPPCAVQRSSGSLSSEQSDIMEQLQTQIPLLVRAVNKQLREKSPKTRQCCFALLTELLRAYPGALADYFSLLFGGIQTSMTDRLSNSNAKIDTLTFLSTALNSHHPVVFESHMRTVIPLVTEAAGDNFYKVSAEALTVIQALIRVLRPSQKRTENNSAEEVVGHVSAIYEAVAKKLKAADIDQEVKEKALAATGLLIAVFGDILAGPRVDECLGILLDRLRNEMTRLATVKALTTIVLSALRIDLTCILSRTLQLLADFLRKNHRALKICTLALLDALVTSYSHGGLDSDSMALVVAETPNLLYDQDLQITQLTLKFISGILRKVPVVALDSVDSLLEKVSGLTESPLLQGATLTALLDMLSCLCQSRDVPQHHIENFCQRLTKLASERRTPPLHRQTYYSIAKCMASIVASHPDQSRAETVARQCEKELNSNVSEGERLYALLTLGEIGRRREDVFTGPRAILQPERLIGKAFEADSEELKTAASYTLGCLAVGNLHKFLPFLLTEINSNPKRQYLLLHALKEVIGSESVDRKAIEIFKPQIGDIWKVLLDHACCGEEGTRNVVAECIGKLCVMDPETLLPKLKGHLMSDESCVRATVVTAVKFMMGDQPQPVDLLLKSCIAEFLQTMTDPDLNVRRVALVTFNSAAHNKPKLVRELLDMLLPSLYAETVVRKELVREVEMGPFKHTVDDGLDLRKAAFECMYTLLETCLERLDMFEFMLHVEDGLKDHHDIKLLTYLMVNRLCMLCPAQVLQRVDRFVDPLKVVLNAKMKANAVKQESEKQEELKRAALRLVQALQRIPEWDKQQQLNDLVTMIKCTPELSNLYQAVERDVNLRSFANDSPMDID